MTRGTQTAAHKIAEGLQEALAIAKGEAEPHRWHNLHTPIPSQDGKTESEGLASAPVTEHEQARVSSHASQADPAGTPPTAGSADQFNDTGPHVFSDREPSA